MGKQAFLSTIEYGRYDAPKYLGVVRGVIVPDSRVNSEEIFFSSLKPILKRISDIAGHGGRIQGVYIEAGDSFSKVDEYIRIRKSQNTTDTRKPYDLTNRQLHTFCKTSGRTSGCSHSMDSGSKTKFIHRRISRWISGSGLRSENQSPYHRRQEGELI